MRSPVVWVLLTVFILITGAGLWLSALNGFQSGVTFALMFVIVFSTMLGVGLIIISRQLSNVIGWLLVVAGFSSALFTLSSEYAQIALFSEGQNLTLGLISAWIAQWIWIGYAASLLLGLPLLFPNGRFLSPRWRLYGWFTAFYILLLWISIAFRPGPLTDFTSFDNPFGVRTFEDTPSFLSQAINLLTAVGLRRTPGMTPLALPFITGAILSLILRYRRSQGDQRAQIKWFTFAACLLLAAVIFGFVQTIGVLPLVSNQLGALIFGLQATLFTLAIGIAMLKYHLYEIDLIIRRTLVYGVLTLFLIILYYSSVVLLQQAFRALTGQDSPVAIVISTLVIAALFNPLRSRVQSAIDRRFYRRKYDARQAMEAFAAAARDEVDLERLEAELVSIVRETMQPEEVSLWLRPTGSSPYVGKRLEVES